MSHYLNSAGKRPINSSGKRVLGASGGSCCCTYYVISSYCRTCTTFVEGTSVVSRNPPDNDLGTFFSGDNYTAYGLSADVMYRITTSTTSSYSHIVEIDEDDLGETYPQSAFAVEGVGISGITTCHALSMGTYNSWKGSGDVSWLNAYRTFDAGLGNCTRGTLVTAGYSYTKYTSSDCTTGSFSTSGGLVYRSYTVGNVLTINGTAQDSIRDLFFTIFHGSHTFTIPPSAGDVVEISNSLAGTGEEVSLAGACRLTDVGTHIDAGYGGIVKVYF